MPRSPDTSEEQLAGFVAKLEPERLGWQVVHFHFSDLGSAHRKAYAVRIAVNGLSDLTRRREGRVFVLANLDVVLLVKGAESEDVEEAVFRTKFLFDDDPLSRRGEAFATWYDLSVQYEELARTTRRLLAAKAERERAPDGEPDELADVEALDPARLYKLQTALASIDLTAYMRRQPVCAIAPGHPPAPVFDEVYVRIADLQRPLMPKVNFTGNRWLFQHLTQTLDARVLALLARRPELLGGPSSLNLTVDTLLSQGFLDFDEACRGAGRPAILIELQAFDVLADLGAFVFARDFAHQRGYRLCLDGLTAASFALIDRDRLGVELFKVYWDEAMRESKDKSIDEFAKAVRTSDRQRLILAHCDEERAIDYGQSLGIGLFQGRTVDRLLRPQAHPRN